MRNKIETIWIALIFMIQIHCCPGQEIKIVDNSLTNITRQFFQTFNNISNIRRVQFISCGISVISKDAFEDLTALESINLYNNSITEINFEVKALKFLFLSKNLLKKSPKLIKFPQLLNLHLDDNQIQNIDYKVKQHPLENLNLSNNPLKEVLIISQKLTDITIINTKPFHPHVNLNINCPNLSSLDTSEIRIRDCDEICKKCKNATIFTSYGSVRDCSINKNEGETDEESDQDEALDYSEDFEKEHNYSEREESDEKEDDQSEHQSNGDNEETLEEKFNTELKNEHLLIEESNQESVTRKRENQIETDSISYLPKIRSIEPNILNSNDNGNKIDQLMDSIRDNMGFPKIYLILIITISILMVLLIGASGLLIYKIRKSTSSEECFNPHIYAEIGEGKKYLTPNKVEEEYLIPNSIIFKSQILK